MRCEDRERIIELVRLPERFRPHRQLALLSHRALEGGKKRDQNNGDVRCLQILSEKYPFAFAAIVQIVTNELSRR
jgi:hypothetical protein